MSMVSSRTCWGMISSAVFSGGGMYGGTGPVNISFLAMSAWRRVHRLFVQAALLQDLGEVLRVILHGFLDGQAALARFGEQLLVAQDLEMLGLLGRDFRLQAVHGVAVLS